MFKIQDLMINVIGGGGGRVAMPTPTEPTPPSPISPVAAVAALSPRFEYVNDIVKRPNRGDMRVLDEFARDIGRAVIGAGIAAQCTEDMATCQDNEHISPFASGGDNLFQSADYAVLREQVLDTAKWIKERDALLDKRSLEHGKALLPQLEEATNYLKENLGK